MPVARLCDTLPILCWLRHVHDDYVQSGKVCTIRYWTRSAIFGQKVVVRPHGGIYGAANETFGAYKANSGFVGDDSFQVDLEYEISGQRFVTHLKANVHVHR